MPLYFFYGSEDFLIEKEIQKIKKRVLSDNINELNYKTDDNPDFPTLIFLLKSQPMMFGESVYNIKVDRYFLDGGKKINLSDREVEEFIEALKLISDRIHIIFTCYIKRGETKKPDSRKKIYKAIQKIAEVKEFQAYKAYEEYKILPVLKTMLKDYNLKSETSILEEIIRRTGPYFRDLAAVLDKISLYVYPNNVITKEAVDFIAPMSQNIFVLIDLILQKNYIKAIEEIKNMMQYSHYLEILGFLQSSFSKILNTKIYSKSMSGFEIAKLTGQNEYAVKMTINKIKNIPLNELIKLKQNLTDADYKIKTGEMEAMDAILEGLLK